MSGDALSQDPAQLRRRIDSTKAHPARVYDFFLGGKDNYPADRTRRPPRSPPIRAATWTSGTTATSCAGR